MLWLIVRPCTFRKSPNRTCAFTVQVRCSGRTRCDGDAAVRRTSIGSLYPARAHPNRAVQRTGRSLQRTATPAADAQRPRAASHTPESTTAPQITRRTPIGSSRTSAAPVVTITGWR